MILAVLVALPYKVFKDCLRCHLFPGCDEVAVVVDLPRREELALAGAAAGEIHAE